PFRDFESRGKCASLETGAVVAVQVGNRQSERLIPLDACACHLLRFIGRIVQHLDIKQISRIVEARDGIHKALDHIAFVIDGKLYGNLWPLGYGWSRAGYISAVLEERVNQIVTMQTIRGQNYQHDEIRNHDGKIEGVELV